MQLQSNVIPAVEQRVSYEGRQAGISVDNGQSLKIESTPGGFEILNASPPAGKKWINIIVEVRVDEVDAM